MLQDETLAAATAIVRTLAKGGAPVETTKLTLPGPDTETKHVFEQELAALQARINYLCKTAIANAHSMPMTPNEFGTMAFDTPISRNDPLPGRARTLSQFPSQVSDFLTAHDDDDEGRQLSGEDLGHVREFVQKQAEEIQTHKEIIADVSKRLDAQQVQAEQTFIKVEHEDISQLRRELQKHQQANFAFQKALKEIGGIITNVANGDLSHKVLIHKVEMDPEISKFKDTSKILLSVHSLCQCLLWFKSIR